MGTLAAVAWVVAIQLRRRTAIPRDPGGQKRFGAIVGASLVGCSMLASLGAVPAFWSAVAPGGPAQPIDLTAFVPAPPQDIVLTPNTLEVRYPRLLFDWTSGAVIKPKSVVEVLPTTLDAPARGNISAATPTSLWPEIRLSVPTDEGRRLLWVRLLVGSLSWVSPHAPSLSHIAFLANGRSVRASSVVWPTPTWAVVNLLIPDTIVGSNGMLTLRAPSVVGKWDSRRPPSAAGRASPAEGPVFVGAGPRLWEPIVSLLPGAGSFYGTVNGVRRHLQFSTAVTGDQGPVTTISGFPATSSFSLSRSSVPFGIDSLLTAGFQWPPAAPFRHREMLVLFGGAWAAVLSALGLVGVLSLRRIVVRH